MVTISGQTARRFVSGKQGLWPGRRWKGRKGTAQARGCTFATAFAIGLVKFAKFLNARQVKIAPVKPAKLRKHLESVLKTEL